MKKLIVPFITLIIWGFSFVIVLQSNDENQFDKQLKKFATLDHPNRAAFRDYLMMMDPQTGKIPFEKLPEAMQQTKIMYRNSQNLQSLQWEQIPSDMGGRTKTIAFDPNDTNHHKVWAGSATGGLWYNPDITDSNSEWVPVSDVWQTLSISSIVFDPQNPQIMYVGTGEYETAIVDMYRESSGRGYGVWKSTDGGQSFQRLSSTQNFQYISDLAIKNESGQSVIYAGVVSGRYHGGTFNSQPSDGLFRSTDGGATWTQVLPNIQGSNVPYTPSDIEITANGRIFVGTKRNLAGDGGACILYSDTGLSGSWQVNTQFKTDIENQPNYNIPGRVKLASAPSNANKVYALIASKSLNETIEGYPKTICKKIVVSNDAGLTWQNKTYPLNPGGNQWAYLAWHALSVAVDPNNDNRLFIGGLEVYMSDNSATSWQKVSDWTAMYGGGGDEYVHADIHSLVFAPGNSGTLLISSDGGVFYTQTANTSNIIFENRNKSFSTLQYYSCAISPQGTELILGGLQDNGSLLYSGAPLIEYDMIQGGDGAQCAFDKDEGLMITSTYDNRFMVYHYDNNIYNYLGDYASGLFYSTFDYDSANNTIWAIASDMHGNRLGEVLKITSILDNDNGSFINLNTGTTTTFSAIRLIDNDNMFIGTIDGKLYKVSHINSTPVAQQIDGGSLPTAFISSIQTLNNGQTILVTLSNYNIQSVWQSTNGGTTWQNVSGNLPDMPIRWAIYHPANADKVMLATEVGVWTTDNVNTANVIWTPQTDGLPRVRVDMVAIRPDNQKVIAGTHGRTLFTTTWDANTSNIETVKTTDFKFYPNPAKDFINLEVKTAGYKVSIYNMNGQLLKEIYNVQNHQKIDVSGLEKGIYLLRYNKTSQKFIIQ